MSVGVTRPSSTNCPRMAMDLKISMEDSTTCWKMIIAYLFFIYKKLNSYRLIELQFSFARVFIDKVLNHLAQWTFPHVLGVFVFRSVTFRNQLIQLVNVLSSKRHISQDVVYRHLHTASDNNCFVFLWNTLFQLKYKI